MTPITYAWSLVRRCLTSLSRQAIPTSIPRSTRFRIYHDVEYDDWLNEVDAIGGQACTGTTKTLRRSFGRAHSCRPELRPRSSTSSCWHTNFNTL